MLGIENENLLFLPPGPIAPELKLLSSCLPADSLSSGEDTKYRGLTLRDFAAVVKGTKEYQERRKLTLEDPANIIKINVGEHKGTTFDKFLGHCVVWEEWDPYKEQGPIIDGEYRILP